MMCHGICPEETFCRFFLQLGYIFLDLFLVSQRLPSLKFTKSWAARASYGHDMENGPGYPWFQNMAQKWGTKKTVPCRTGLTPPSCIVIWPQFVLREHWHLDYPGFYIFTIGFVIFCLNNVCQCCWVQIQRLPDKLVINGQLGLFRNWGARKLQKFLIISQWNRLQCLAQNHFWTTASYGWLYNVTVHLL